MTTPGSTLKLIDSPRNRESNYWYSLLQQGQQCVLAKVGPDGLWDVVFVDPRGVPHAVEGVSPERFTVITPAPWRRWWQFWMRS